MTCYTELLERVADRDGSIRNKQEILSFISGLFFNWRTDCRGTKGISRCRDVIYIIISLQG